MKKMIFLVSMITTLSNAYCEYGNKQSQEYVQGGYYVTYLFSDNRRIGVKYSYGKLIPYTILFDFYSMEMCR
jgi:hypothetical protein